MPEQLKVGDLFTYQGTEVWRKGAIGVYLGEDFIHRDDGVTVENHKVLYNGELSPTIIDRGVLRWLCKL